MRVVLLLTVLVLGSAGCASTPGSDTTPAREFPAATERFRSAVERDDVETIYSMLSKKERERFGSVEAFKRWWKKNRLVVLEESRKRAVLVATLALDDGSSVTLVQDGGGWKVKDAPEFALGANTPGEVIAKLVAFMERMYDKEYLALLSPPARERLLRLQESRIGALRILLTELDRKRPGPEQTELTVDARGRVGVTVTLERIGNRWFIRSLSFSEISQ